MSVEKYEGLLCGFTGPMPGAPKFNAMVTRNISVGDRARIATWMGWEPVLAGWGLSEAAAWDPRPGHEGSLYRVIDFDSLDACDHISRHIMTLPRVVQNQYLMQLLQETTGNRVKEEKLDPTKHHLSAIVALARPIDRVRSALTIIGMMDKGWPNDAQVREMQVVAGPRASIAEVQARVDAEEIPPLPPCPPIPLIEVGEDGTIDGVKV